MWKSSAQGIFKTLVNKQSFCSHMAVEVIESFSHVKSSPEKKVQLSPALNCPRVTWWWGHWASPCACALWFCPSNLLRLSSEMGGAGRGPGSLAAEPDNRVAGWTMRVGK